jgi:hypothetical protein
MKPMLIILLAVGLSTHWLGGQGLPAPRQLVIDKTVSTEEAKDLGAAAIEELVKKFSDSRGAEGLSSFVIVPLPRDLQDGYFTLQFENAFTQHASAAGYKLYSRGDRALAQILEQAAWGQNFSDVLDPATIQELGKMVDFQAIIYPRIDISRGDSGETIVRANMQILERQTAQVHWSGEVKKAGAMKLSAEQWALYGGIGLGALGVLLVLFWLYRSIQGARRPR